jgi:phosphoserine phosphatase
LSVKIPIMPQAIVFFDVDGTIVPRTSSSQYLASFMGHADALATAERAYADGALSNQEVSVLDATGWNGYTTTEVSSWLADLPLVDGILDVVGWLKDRDVVSALTTLAWEPVGTFLRNRFGFVEACGPRVEMINGRFTGKVSQHCDEFDKRDFALRFAAANGVPATRCAAVGDSRSDEPLFEAVGFSVAFNSSSSSLLNRANVSVVGNDLRQIVPLIEPWLDARAAGLG